jgi:hypothetical protein
MECITALRRKLVAAAAEGDVFECDNLHSKIATLEDALCILEDES